MSNEYTASLEREIEELQSTNEKLLDAIEELKSERDSAKEELKELREEYEELQEEHEALQEKVGESKEELEAYRTFKNNIIWDLEQLSGSVGVKITVTQEQA